jgi:hypothetical protein
MAADAYKLPAFFGWMLTKSWPLTNFHYPFWNHPALL